MTKEPTIGRRFYHHGINTWCVVTQIDRSATGGVEKVHYRQEAYPPLTVPISGKDWPRYTNPF